MKKNTAYIFYGPGFSYPALTWMPTVVLSSVRRQPGALLIIECVKLSPVGVTHSCFFPINLHQCHSLFLEQKMSYCTKVQRKQWENSCPSRNVFKNSFPPKKKKNWKIKLNKRGIRQSIEETAAANLIIRKLNWNRCFKMCN